MPVSSSSSRTSAAAALSPASTLPPGNSQRPASALPAGRCAISTRPRSSKTRPATTHSSRTPASVEAAVAVLELLARAARTRLVASHLARLAHDGFAGRSRAQLAARRHFTARETTRERRGRREPAHATGRRRALTGSVVRDDRLRRRVLQLQLLHRHLPLALALLFFDLGFVAHLQPREQRHRVVLDALEQRAEEFECFALIFLLRVLLRIGPQMD